MSPRLKHIFRIASVFVLLYFFLVSIALMSASFKLFGKGFAEQLISSCSNPFVGLFIGILATSIIQSSSTTTSLVVGFVGGGMLPIGFAIPIIMGANIGTTITNILVSLAFVTRKEDFRRAFAGATVHDFFNLCAVALFFPLELKFHFIQKSAVVLTRLFEGAGGVKITSPLKLIIDPAVHGIKHLMVDVASMPKLSAGVIMLVMAFAVLIASLIYLVKTMRILIIDKAEIFIDRYLFRNDLTAILLGVLLTVLVQSSSVTTSLIVPLVGAGIVTLNRCYPFTLGANIGTTCTAILASLATVSVASGGAANTMGVTAAFAHLMFNMCGIAVFYPLKKIPISLARGLANLAAEKKKWAVIFVLTVFFIIPLMMIMLTKGIYAK
ncbi:MAG: Na/Pi symporter [Candidatus Omnitrophota bacterium]